MTYIVKVIPTDALRSSIAVTKARGNKRIDYRVSVLDR